MNQHGQPCYTYLVGWRELDRWYYGYRSANRVEPEDDLLKFYPTSSKYVKEFTQVNGQPDVVLVHKLFDTKKEAQVQETRFLKRIGAVKSNRWLNRHDGEKIRGPDRHSEETKRKMRHPHKPISDDAKVRMRAGALKRAPASLETRQKISSGNKGKKRSLETCLKQRSKVVSEQTKMKLRIPKVEVECPRCKKVGGVPTMTRWHFDNCKVST